jgi:hypothetical protein
VTCGPGHKIRNPEEEKSIEFSVRSRSLRAQANDGETGKSQGNRDKDHRASLQEWSPRP